MQESHPAAKWNASTILMLILGFGVLTVDAWQSYRTVTFLHHATHVTGVISDPTPHPRIRFTTPDRGTFEFVQNGFVSRPLGASVPVVYNSADPAGTAHAATFGAIWGPVLWLLPMGLGFTLLPFFGVRWQPRGAHLWSRIFTSNR
jgi:hypothetical protein